MNLYLISYANRDYYKNQRRLNDSALQFGVDTIRPYIEKEIQKSHFFAENRSILEQNRGAGCWLWKPYIILDQLNHLQSGDCLFYADSGVEIIRDLTPLVDLCIQQDGILLFSNDGHLNKTWTKRDCFVLMGCDAENYHNAEQLSASFQVYIKNQKTIDFVEEWLSYCQNPHILTDLSNTCGLENFPEFIEHRWDQSVLSLLAVKHDLEIFRDPSQWGNHMKMPAFREPGEWLSKPYSESCYINSPYYTLLNHHRDRPLSFKLDQFAKKVKSKMETLHGNFF